MPFMYFASEIEKSNTTKQLYEMYLGLHRQACVASGGLATGAFEDIESPISYNLGLTNTAMIICPRTCEGIKIKCESGESVGPVSLNGTLLGGTLLVKSKAEWDLLKSNESKLKDVLSSVGIYPSGNKHGGKI